MSRASKTVSYAAVCVLLSTLMVALAACGGSRSAATPAATLAPISTPKGAFAQATTVITPEAAATSPAAATDLAMGQRVWDGKCASCHGAKGEGVADKGKGIAEWTFTEAEMEDLLRTGAKGKLGNEHLFGPSQISPGGIRNLYAFIETLKP